MRVFSNNIAFLRESDACFCWIAVSILSHAQCKPAQPGDVPHGANELIELKEEKLSQIFGTIRFPQGELADDIVVEVYRRARTQSLEEARQQARLAACVTSDDGRILLCRSQARKVFSACGHTKECRHE